ncbi:helix-turn-helix domain-containing protein [Streptomyces sp. NPDC056773]|uniref:AraC-like ligand-binding domain-containing protein n=1 Tax=unclassified Streptomyces TaxID=2593676 RepID=UPI0036869886
MSSAAVPAADRFDWFADVVAQELVSTSIKSEHARDFRAEAAVLDLGCVQVKQLGYAPLHSRRTAAHVRSSDPEQYQLGLVTSGSTWVAQNRHDSGPFSGELVLWDTSRPFESGVLGTQPLRVVILSIPRTALPLRPDRVDRVLAERIPADRGMGAILAQYMRSLAEHGEECAPAELEQLGSVALDLAGACLAGRLGAEDELSEESRTRALLARIDTFIGHNLGDPELTPSVVAARHSLSLRRLQMLFRERGESVAAAVRRRRLERCREDLTDPAQCAVPVHTVALRWGFTNASVFSRLFRETYGASPSEFRRTAAEAAGTFKPAARIVNDSCAQRTRRDPEPS